MFTTDTKGELYLKGLGVAVTYREDVCFDELVSSWNTANLGRPEGHAKVNSAIETYAELMESGSAAPAVFLWVTPKGLDVLDGIQRLNAAMLTGASRFGAYLVECSERTAKKIRIASNVALAGAAPVDSNWCVREMVIAFMIDGSDTAKDIADFCRKKVSDVEKVYEQESVRRQIDALWGDGTAPQLKLGEYDAYAEWSEPDDFNKAGKVVQQFTAALNKCAFKNGDSRRFIQDFFTIKRIGSKNRETQLRSKLRTFLDDPLVSGRLNGRKKADSIENMTRHLKTCHNWAKEHDKAGGTISDPDVARQWDELIHETCRYLRKQCTTEIRNAINPFASV